LCKGGEKRPNKCQLKTFLKPAMLLAPLGAPTHPHVPLYVFSKYIARNDITKSMPFAGGYDS